MGYRSEIYKKAFKIKNDMIKSAVSSYEASLASLRERSEEFRKLELEMSKIGPTVALAALSGEADKFDELKGYSDRVNAEYKAILSENGISAPEFFCEACEDTGYKKGELCDCIKDIAKALVAEELSRSMPVGNCRFDNFDLNYYSDTADENGAVPRRRAQAALNMARKFAEDFPAVSKSLLFMGETGLGKTHLSLAIVAEVSAKGYSVVYGPAGKLFTAAEKEHFAFSGETEKLDSLLECDLLVIDDLGTEFLSSFTTSLFYNIINSRLLEGKPTVISTNLSIDEIEKRYTARIASRFIGNYEYKKLIGNDIRQQKAFENK